jgi:hypothetical protein
MSAARHVVVTGMGMVSAAGAGAPPSRRAGAARHRHRSRSRLRDHQVAVVLGPGGRRHSRVLIDRDAAAGSADLSVRGGGMSARDGGWAGGHGPQLGLVVGTNLAISVSGEFATGKRGPAMPMLFRAR